MHQILLAEDSQFSVRDLTRKLRAWDEAYELTVVRDGQAAIDMLDPASETRMQPAPDLIILDLKMPRVDGLEVLGFIRETPGLHDLPVVVLTTSDSPFDMDLADVLQVNDYLVKGADANTVCRILAKHSRRRAPRLGTSGPSPSIGAGPADPGPLEPEFAPGPRREP
ncbi:response regulator [Frigidibacter sp. ROC022]|uniref:response regulator n=1 Tax=Frigidibacter sp. ROC022 TaxID=2971796 RepID=UPI00215A7D91|nr:response regulator [Frigidibacter sp. ROC022]MCR8723157.1 response regulator [Frigidibacter sp. ROC022]